MVGGTLPLIAWEAMGAFPSGIYHDGARACVVGEYQA